ncbi:MAG: hypothetical protein II621_05380 [Clostridia bacterium]|nr:hypothetical protein [Clostridia bacterium]
MAYEMIKTVLQAESLAKQSEEAAKQQAQSIMESARKTAASLEQAAVEQAQNEAKLILSEAQYTADGLQKQAAKLAELREKKVIAETEKRYDEAIRLVLAEKQAKNRLPYDLEISVGYDSLKDKNDTMEACLARADEKLYKDKKGKGSLR